MIANAAPAAASRRLAAFLLLIASTVFTAVSQPIELLTVPDPSQPPVAGGGGDSVAPILSSDGRYVLFSSIANNLALTSSNTAFRANPSPRLNVFLHDSAGNSLVSVSLAGTGGGNGDSIATDVAKYGQYALFESSASDLVAGDTNACEDVFWRDINHRLTRVVSVSTNGLLANGASGESSMTLDGRYVAFVSKASNLVPGDTNGIPDVFVMDMQSNQMMLASVGAISTNKASSAGGSGWPDITADGRYVVFYSTATNLVPGVPPGGDIYVRDLVDGITYWASVDARALLTTMTWMGSPTNAVMSHPMISKDGQYVVYRVSPATGSAINAGLILRYSLDTGLTEVVYTNASVVASCPADEMRAVDMTPDGEFIAFVANASTFSGDLGKFSCVRVWDGLTGNTVLASPNLSGNVPANSVVLWPTIDSTGRFVAFMSLVTNQSVFVTNALKPGYHVYVRDLIAGTTKAVDVDPAGFACGVSSYALSRLVAGGQYLAFQAPDGSLVAGDRNHADDVFLRDLVTATTSLVSAKNPSLPSLTPGGWATGWPLSASEDGRYLAFTSEADDLVPNDTNKCQDVFVRDLAAGVNYLVSCRSNGLSPWDGSSMEPSISADGRYVAFTSYATNLVAVFGKTNRLCDVFVRDMVAGTTALVSVNLTRTGAGNGNSYSPSISADGRGVLFHSLANNLAPGISGTMTDNLYYRDLPSGITHALSTNGVGGAAMTPDGRWVAFIGRTNYSPCLLSVWDSQSAAIVYATNNLQPTGVSISPDGNRLAYADSWQMSALDWRTGARWSVGPLTFSSRVGMKFSADGRYLVYASTTAQLLSDANNTYDVYLYDLQTSTKLLVSQSSTPGTAASDASDCPDISPDGRLVAYRSVATNIVAGDVNGAGDVFLYDRATGKTTLLSMRRGGGGTANYWSFRPCFTTGGRQVLFASTASDVVGFDFNQGSDLFAYEMFYSQISPGALPAQSPTLSWPAVPGKTYSVQYRTSLKLPTWYSAAGNVTIVGDRAYFTDPTAPATQRYYRIVSN